MPIYRIHCQICDEQDDIFRRIAERDNLPLCICGGKMERVLTPTFLQSEIEAYVSPYSGEVISSREQRREDMKRGGYVDYEPGMQRDIQRNREYQQQKAFEPIAKTVDELVTAMNVTGKLEN